MSVPSLCYVHPTLLLSITDHLHRVESISDETLKKNPIVGLVLGRATATSISLLYGFELGPGDLHELNSIEKRLDLLSEIYGGNYLQLVGFYSVGSTNDYLFDKVIQNLRALKKTNDPKSVLCGIDFDTLILTTVPSFQVTKNGENIKDCVEITYVGKREMCEFQIKFNQAEQLIFNSYRDAPKIMQSKHCDESGGDNAGRICGGEINVSLGLLSSEIHKALQFVRNVRTGAIQVDSYEKQKALNELYSLTHKLIVVKEELSEPGGSTNDKINELIALGSPGLVSADAEYETFPLKALTQEELEETRYHVLKFHSVKKIDPAKDFERPTRLHRKDPKNLQFQMSLKELEQKKVRDAEKEQEQIAKRKEYIAKTGKTELTDEQIDEEIEVEGLDERDRKIYEEKKKKEKEIQEKEEERNRQMQLVAPDGGARKSKKQVIKKRTKQVKVYNEAKRKLRYEEFYPWVLEDYDAKQAWVGNYEAGLHDNYCMLILDPVTKCFKLAPVEKFYKFTSRNKYATLTLEEAEAKMKQGSSGQRWLMRKMLDEVETESDEDLDDLFEVKKEDKESKKLRKALSKNAMNEVYASDDDESENPYLSESEVESEEENQKEKEEEVKVKVESDDEVNIKMEPADETQFSSPARKRNKSIYISGYRGGFLTIKATKKILSQFTHGEWNPRTAIRRDLTEDRLGQEHEVNTTETDPNKLTRADIDALLVNGPIDLSVMVKALRGKMHKDPNSKDTLKQILKEHFILKNKQVHPKE
ncbi:Transcription initiation factor IIF subunit alpha [Pichia kudriavzevii]|uniref:Transcription initiation factor IIF subunit alpha n=1 Tax=Pichia kudriavzevii TaxID=4909 RepID=A0A1V2LRF8_PICKU|nr:Transcription initiation factor IIF subunit alpha [Pichia kudriavzevii]